MVPGVAVSCAGGAIRAVSSAIAGSLELARLAGTYSSVCRIDSARRAQSSNPARPRRRALHASRYVVFRIPEGSHRAWSHPMNSGGRSCDPTRVRQRGGQLGAIKKKAAVVTTSEPKRQLTREDWIDAATKRLVNMSVEAVRVEPLAAEIGVSRGSFYWHFKSRKDLLEAILGRWRENQTRRIVERIKQDRRLGAREQLSQLRTLRGNRRADDAAALELAIRAWARRDKLAKRIVSEVDRERLEFTISLMVEGGAGEADAQSLALLGYAYTIGESLLQDVITQEQIAQCRGHILDQQIGALKDGG
ncbi:MAG: TetR/AcrR family transcriptional regulator [Phenylobacterium sp.]|nr:MAG: TetR/AcrR family transcriptional regulator [Phenylobacterium sp.]